MPRPLAECFSHAPTRHELATLHCYNVTLGSSSSSSSSSSSATSSNASCTGSSGDCDSSVTVTHVTAYPFEDMHAGARHVPGSVVAPGQPPNPPPTDGGGVPAPAMTVLLDEFKLRIHPSRPNSKTPATQAADPVVGGGDDATLEEEHEEEDDDEDDDHNKHHGDGGGDIDSSAQAKAKAKAKASAEIPLSFPFDAVGRISITTNNTATRTLVDGGGGGGGRRVLHTTLHVETGRRAYLQFVDHQRPLPCRSTAIVSLEWQRQGQSTVDSAISPPPPLASLVARATGWLRNDCAVPTEFTLVGDFVGRLPPTSDPYARFVGRLLPVVSNASGSAAAPSAVLVQLRVVVTPVDWWKHGESSEVTVASPG